MYRPAFRAYVRTFFLFARLLPSDPPPQTSIRSPAPVPTYPPSPSSFVLPPVPPYPSPSTYTSLHPLKQVCFIYVYIPLERYHVRTCTQGACFSLLLASSILYSWPMCFKLHCRLGEITSYADFYRIREVHTSRVFGRNILLMISRLFGTSDYQETNGLMRKRPRHE